MMLCLRHLQRLFSFVSFGYFGFVLRFSFFVSVVVVFSFTLLFLPNPV